MKRFHLHMSVSDLDTSVKFYSALFGTPPTVLKPDYAKWMLDDPRVNFAISKRGFRPGIDHVGIQVDSAEELTALREQAAAADIATAEQTNATCCYARSDKYWITDPQGIAWETFHTLESIPIYGDSERVEQKPGCCSNPGSPSLDSRSGPCCA